MSRRRAATASGDMSTPRGIGEASVALRSLIARRRAYTASGVMLTTRGLLQALDVDDVLGSAGRELERDEAAARDDPQRAGGHLGRRERDACSRLPHRFERTLCEQDVEHQG